MLTNISYGLKSGIIFSPSPTCSSSTRDYHMSVHTIQYNKSLNANKTKPTRPGLDYIPEKTDMECVCRASGLAPLPGDSSLCNNLALEMRKALLARIVPWWERLK